MNIPMMSSDEMLDRDLDAGENPEGRFVAPANIQDDTDDPAEQKYLEYLYSVMDADAVEELTDSQEVAVNPQGIMYLTAGSSSGSKYLRSGSPDSRPILPTDGQQDVPTYSIIDITETTLTLNTYRTDTDEAIDTQFMIVKSADHSQLAALIQEAEALNSKSYTAESFSILQQALEAARTADSKAEADTSELTNAYSALKSAMDALESVPTQTPSADPTESPVPTSPDTTVTPTVTAVPTQSGSGQGTTIKAPGVNEKPSAVKPVNTGDDTNAAIPAAALILAAALSGTIIYARRKRG